MRGIATLAKGLMYKGNHPRDTEGPVIIWGRTYSEKMAGSFTPS